MMVGYARLADKHGAAVLIIAAELWAAMTNKQNEPRWRKLVREVRAVYKGKLAFATNANTLIPWADSIDILGFDMYNGVKEHGGLPRIVGPGRPTVDELAGAWAGYIGWLRNVSAAAGKPVMATELGYQSRPRSFVSPAGSARFNPGDCSVYLKCYNMEDQRLAYAAFYQAFSAATAGEAEAEGGTSWFVGVLWWMWRSDPTSGGVNDLTFTPQGKPAGAEIKKFAEHQGTLLSVPEPATHAAYSSVKAAPAVLQSGPGEAAAGPWPQKENGIVVGSGEWTSYEDPVNSSHLDSAAAAASLADARAHGVNAAEFIPTWFF
jgi:hypothetical protein